MYGTQNAKVFARDGQIDIDKPSQLNQQDNHIWSYPTKHFDKYKSATIHTHKGTVPKWMKRSLYGFILILVVLAFLIPKSIPFFTGQASADQIQFTGNETKSMFNPAPVTQKVVSSKPVACLSNDSTCVCYDSLGHKMSVTYEKCKLHTEGFLQYLDIKPARSRRAVASEKS